MSLWGWLSDQSLFWFLVVVGPLIFLHEAGHFVTAKLFGIRVEVFSLGFGHRLFGRKLRGTDYRVSLLPLGGYVAFAEPDEPEDGTPAPPPPPDYFAARPRWQRVLVMAAGPVVNLGLAVGLHAFAFVRGIEMPASEPAIIQDVEAGTAAQAAGLRPGDEIVNVGGRPTSSWTEVIDGLIRAGHDKTRVEVLRGGDRLGVDLAPEFRYGEVPYLGVRGGLPAVVSELDPKMPGAQAGLRDGDRIEAIDGAPILSLSQLLETVHQSPGRELKLSVRRGEAPMEIRVVPKGMDVAGKLTGFIGFRPRPPLEMVKLGPLAATVRAARLCVQQADLLIHVVRNLITRRLSFTKTMSGPLAIAQESKSHSRNLSELAFWMAIISLQLGILNLLPIPVLDGGQMLVLAVEGLRRKDLSVRVKRPIQMVGFAALVLLMATVILLDVKRQWASREPEPPRLQAAPSATPAEQPAGR